MSEQILLDTVRDRIRSAFTLDAEQCMITLDGRPPVGNPSVLFVGVHSGNVTGTPSERQGHHMENYRIHITVSQRTAWLPAGQEMERVIINDSAYDMNGLIQRIMVDICDLPNAATLVSTANTALEAAYPSATYGFSGYFRYGGMDAPVTRRSDWMGQDRDRNAYLGISRTLHLFGVYRPQEFGNVTR